MIKKHIVEPWGRLVRQPAFLACAALLGVSAAGLRAGGEWLQWNFRKEAAPLRKGLVDLDRSQLGSYEVIREEPLTPEIEMELGTEEYINWVLEDTEADAKSPVRQILLFVTYYPFPDRVPHVPEECYAGSGYQKIASDNIIFKINKSGFDKQVPGKYLVFGSTKANIWNRDGKFPVAYFFRVNGVYAGNREDARLALNRNIFRKHSYFCKVELVFNQKFVIPTKEQAVIACEKILNIILPVFEKEHWPDLKNAD